MQTTTRIVLLYMWPSLPPKKMIPHKPDTVPMDPCILDRSSPSHNLSMRLQHPDRAKARPQRVYVTTTNAQERSRFKAAVHDEWRRQYLNRRRFSLRDFSGDERRMDVDERENRCVLVSLKVLNQTSNYSLTAALPSLAHRTSAFL